MPAPFQIKEMNPDQDLAVLKGLLYFFADDNIHGKELWVSDGTATGTRLVKDLTPGWQSSMLMGLVAKEGKLYFIAWHPTLGMGLCVSDGTSAGTKFLTHGLISSLDKQGSVALGNVLYFVKWDGKGYELWKTDGTSKGTTLFLDINPGPDGSDPAGLTRAGDKLFFVANDGQAGKQLWVTNGSTKGTRRVNPKLNYRVIYSEMVALGNNLLFAAAPRNDNSAVELWITDGTTTGTRMLANINAGDSSYPRNFTVVNNKVFFTANDGIHGEELWITDGTAKGTRLLRDIHIGAGDCNLFSPTRLGNRLFFLADDGRSGRELWVSDGTTSGTRLVKDLQPGIGSVLDMPNTLTAVGDKLYFTFDSPQSGRELWRSDGTAAGTKLVADLNPGTGDSGIKAMAVAGRHLFFPAEARVFEHRLWALDVSADITGASPSLHLAQAKQPLTSTTLAITADASAKLEGDTGLTAFTFTVKRTGGLSSPSSADWKVSGSGSKPSSADDFDNQQFPQGVVSFAAGEASRSITVLVRGEMTIENDEQFSVTLSHPSNATLSTASAQATIKNDDLPLITLTVSPSVREDGKVNLMYSFKRSGPTTTPLTVKAKVGGTAQLGKDYRGLATTSEIQTITFAAGASTATVTVKPLADSTIEPDETVSLALLAGTGYRIGTPEAVIGTILNDDVPTYVITPSQRVIREGQTLTTTIRTTGLPSQTQLYWALSGEGIQAADFSAGALTGSGLVGNGGTFSFSHTVRNDATTEWDESLQLQLYTDAARTRAVGSAVTVKILDTSRTANDSLQPVTIRGSNTIASSLTTNGEVDSYAVDVVSGAILTAKVTSENPIFYPLIHLKDQRGSILKNPIAYNGTSADLGMVDLLTGRAIIDIKTQIGTTGSYSLNVSVTSREAIRDEVFQLTNREREKAGLAPLKRNSLLEQAAEGHVQDMDASNAYLAHTGSNGSSPVDRIKATGYKAAWFDLGNGSMRTISSENAAAGYMTAAEVVQAWMNSSGHKAAIMDPATKEIGVGFDYDNETGSTYWIQNFGLPWSPGMTQWF